MILDAMGMVKLNTFHWHITDSQSFPLVLKSHPELSRLGAYSSDKVYTADDISEVNNILQSIISDHRQQAQISDSRLRSSSRCSCHTRI